MELNRLENPDRPEDVSRETINQLTAYFAERLIDFTIPLRPAGTIPAHRYWLDVMANITFGTTISYAAFAAAAGAPRAAQAAGIACATNPIPIIYACHWVARKNDTTRHYSEGNELAPSHKDNLAHKAFLTAHEKGQLDGGQRILT